MRFLRSYPPVANRPPGEDLPQTNGSPRAALAEVADAPQQRDARLEPTLEQTRYARLLEKGTQLGLLCLLITFPVYIFGVVEPHIPVAKLSDSWTLDAGRYRSEAGIEAGWGWVTRLGQGDFMNFVGIAVLGSVTGFCYCAVIPMLLKRKDWIYAVLAVLQVLVFIVAASGIVGMGH
jgi:hypothetical protein